MKRAGFTMIELIFVIVILGILAAVAIPKLAATRDDAEIAARATQIQTAINEIGAYAVATNTYDDDMRIMSTAINAMAPTGAAATEAHPATHAALSGTTVVFDVRNSIGGLACVNINEGEAPWTGDAATDKAAVDAVVLAGTVTAWTAANWANQNITKFLFVNHTANVLGGCDILQNKIPQGATTVKGRSAQF